MTATETGTLSVVLGRCIEPGTPLGPFTGTPLKGFTTASETGLIHAVEECPRLRKASSVRAVDFTLDASSLARLCTNWSCRWPVPDHGRWPVFLDALNSLSWLRTNGEDVQEQLPDEAEVDEAVQLLSQGEYPEDEDDTDAWERYRQARECRDEILADWQGTQDRLITAGEALAACPWLHPWAEARMAAYAKLVEQKRQMVIRFYSPRALAEAAAVSSLADPEGTPGTGFGIFGRDARVVLRRVWQAWRAHARWGATSVTMAALSAGQELHENLGRRRKGREEAEEALSQLTSAWADQARLAAAEQSAGRPWRLIGVQIPSPHRSPHGGIVYNSLTAWELAVFAVYQVAVDWYRGTAALWVPHGIGEQLLTPEGSMESVDLLEAPEDWAAPASVLLAAWEPRKGESPE
ncbi:hypothetical protein ACSNOH_14440 [Streptomyces sp. URMC 127]|uniref:hypothetical protein n=1 Tax=Streptomyces sp. URMC 127 TaxID=3423402 RepID=UPI003F1C1A5C